MRDALGRPGVPSLLAACLLFMTAFYGVYAYLGDHVRGLLGLSATRAGWVVLAYGAGFGLAAFADRAVDRVGPDRLLAPALACVALPATYALATAVAPRGRGAETLGRVLTGWSLSLVAGVPLSAYVASALSWRAS